MGEWHHGHRVNLLIGLGHDLLRRRAGAKREALAMGAAHAKRVPSLQTLERVVGLQQNQQHLIRGRRVGRAACRRHHAVRLDGVGDDGGLAFQRDLSAFVHDGRLARTDVAAALAFGGGRGEQQLFGRHPAQNPLDRGIALDMAHDARHLDLVHGIDERGRGARLPERVAHIDDLGKRGPFAVEGRRHHDAEQALTAQFRKGFVGKSRLRIDGDGVRTRDFRRRARPREEMPLPRADNRCNIDRHSLCFHGLRFHRRLK